MRLFPSWLVVNSQIALEQAAAVKERILASGSGDLGTASQLAVVVFETYTLSELVCDKVTAWSWCEIGFGRRLGSLEVLRFA